MVLVRAFITVSSILLLLGIGWSDFTGFSPNFYQLLLLLWLLFLKFVLVLQLLVLLLLLLFLLLLRLLFLSLLLCYPRVPVSLLPSGLISVVRPSRVRWRAGQRRLGRWSLRLTGRPQTAVPGGAGAVQGADAGGRRSRGRSGRRLGGAGREGAAAAPTPHRHCRHTDRADPSASRRHRLRAETADSRDGRQQRGQSDTERTVPEMERISDWLVE